MEDWLRGFRGGLLGADSLPVPDEKLGVLGLCGTLDKAALDKVAYKDFMESKKLPLGVVDPFPGSETREVSLNDIARRNLPALSVSKSALRIFPVDLLSSLLDLRSLLTSA